MHMRTHLLNTLLIAGIAGLSFASSTASASVIFLTGNNPQPGEQNVLFSTGTGTTVSGTTNMSGTLVNFSSSTGQTLITNSSGQAKITTNDNDSLITSINVSSPGNTFLDFIGNPEHSGAFTVTVKTNDGTFTDNFPGGPGENFVTILAQGNETISSVAFTSSAGFGTFDQPRISGIASAVPEPSTWAMMLLGFAGLGFAFRQSRRRVSFP
jgi:PEP-CTERM motif